MTDTTTDTQQAGAAPKATYFDGPTPRSRTIPLRWPFVLDGQEYREVTIRRITGIEAKRYFQSIMQAILDGKDPMVFPGLDLPDEAWGALDDEDLSRIEEATEDFLTERFRPLRALLVGEAADGGTSMEHGAK